MFRKIVYFLKFWHPSVSLRYLPIVSEINQNFQKGDTVLEVGSGTIGIAPYLNREVIGLDQHFEGKKFELLKQVIGDGMNLPFADKSFDFVVSADVLEHILPSDRQKAVFELLRVAKKELILAFPEGEAAERHDRELYEEFNKRKISDHAEDFFKEHLENGLPNVKEITGFIEEWLGENDFKGEIRVIDNLNINLRKFLMNGWMTNNFLVNLFFRKILLFFIPILRFFNNKPTYRKIIFVKIK